MALTNPEETFAQVSARHRDLVRHAAPGIRYTTAAGEPMAPHEMAVARALGWVRPQEALEAILADGARRPLTYAELTELQAMESGIRG